MSKPSYEESVFINCPFDSEYYLLFEAIIFTVHDCGFVARCAREISDSSQVRIDKIFQIISDCKYGIHDISRTELDDLNNLPRFNMPLELGMFLAAKRFGSGKHKQNFVWFWILNRFAIKNFARILQDKIFHRTKIKLTS